MIKMTVVDLSTISPGHLTISEFPPERDLWADDCVLVLADKLKSASSLNTIDEQVES